MKPTLTPLETRDCPAFAWMDSASTLFIAASEASVTVRTVPLGDPSLPEGTFVGDPSLPFQEWSDADGVFALNHVGAVTNVVFDAAIPDPTTGTGGTTTTEPTGTTGTTTGVTASAKSTKASGKKQHGGGLYTTSGAIHVGEGHGQHVKNAGHVNHHGHRAK